MFGLFTSERAPANMQRTDGVTGEASTFPPGASGVPEAFASFGPAGLQMPIDPSLAEVLLSHRTIHEMGLGQYLQTMALNHHVQSRYGSGPATRFPLPFMNIGKLTVGDIWVTVLEQCQGHDVLGMDFLSRVAWERRAIYIDARPL